MRLRKNHANASETIGEIDSRPRRDGRGWGPFSGGQLTVIVVVVVVMILFPVGAWALSFTNVSLIDPGGVYRAKVTSAGQLQTHPNGPLTVAGAITATPAAAGNTFAKETPVAATGCVAVATPPAGKALIVTSIHVTETGTTDTQAYLFRDSTTSGFPCFTGGVNGLSVGKNRIEWVKMAAGTSLDLPYPSGLVVKNGDNLNFSAGSEVFAVTVVGYLIPSASCVGSGCTYSSTFP